MLQPNPELIPLTTEHAKILVKIATATGPVTWQNGDDLLKQELKVKGYLDKGLKMTRIGWDFLNSQEVWVHPKQVGNGTSEETIVTWPEWRGEEGGTEEDGFESI